MFILSLIVPSFGQKVGYNWMISLFERSTGILGGIRSSNCVEMAVISSVKFTRNGGRCNFGEFEGQKLNSMVEISEFYGGDL